MPHNTDVNEDECRKLEETKGLKDATLLKKKRKNVFKDFKIQAGNEDDSYNDIITQDELTKHIASNSDNH